MLRFKWRQPRRTADSSLEDPLRTAEDGVFLGRHAAYEKYRQQYRKIELLPLRPMQPRFTPSQKDQWLKSPKISVDDAGPMANKIRRKSLFFPRKTTPEHSRLR
jgi:hypothetical protein